MTGPQLDLHPGHLMQVREILHRYLPEFEVRAFGSRINGTAYPYSDIDLVVITDTPLDLARMADVKEAFSESDLPIKVDIVDWASTKENFRRILEKTYIVIQERVS